MSAAIYFDARMHSHPGIGRYIRELCSAMIKSGKIPPVKFISDKPFLKSIKNEDVVVSKSKIYSPYEQWEMFRLASKATVLHVPNFNVPLFYKGKLITTVHDLTYLKEPGMLKNPLAKTYARILFNHLSQKSNHIIAVSEHTKKDILEMYPRIDSSKISVIYEAASEIFKPTSDETKLSEFKNKYKLTKPFVLFVGSLKPHKNLTGLLTAMKSLRNAGKTAYELVVVGRQDVKYPEILNNIRQNDFVKYLGELPDHELVLAYNAARAFVLPSFREGFGLPVLEAMSCACPVICSSASSLPEVGGQAAVYFDPQRVDHLESALYNVLSDVQVYESMKQKSLSRAAEFNWEKAADKTMTIYRKYIL